MDLFRDVLDIELLDEHKRHIGRVDGITLEISDAGDRPPRVVTMDVGAATLADRLHPRIGAFVRTVLQRVLHMPANAVGIPMHTIRDIGVDIEIAVDAEREPDLLRSEKAARRIVRRIPGGGKS